MRPTGQHSVRPHPGLNDTLRCQRHILVPRTTADVMHGVAPIVSVHGQATQSPVPEIPHV